MKTTGNLGLKKPDGTDIVDITDLNGNMDILDTAVKTAQDHAADTVKHITATERSAWNAKASTAVATTTAAGLMAAADKSKLDSVAQGANNYVHPSTHLPSVIVQDSSNRFVTDAEKTAWNGKANLVTTPQQTTAVTTYFVRVDGNDNNTGLANTAAGAFKTINKAISMIPQVVNHTVTISVAAGTYAEDVIISGTNGAGYVSINGTSASIRSFTAARCNRIVVSGFTATSTTQSAFYAYDGGKCDFTSCIVIASNPNTGISFFNQRGLVEGCTISNRSVAIHVEKGQVTVTNCSGTGNATAILTSAGAIVNTDGTIPSGAITGGNGGVLNPWGDNTKTSRPIGEMHHENVSTSQVVPAMTWTKILFTANINNNKSITDIPNSRFVIPEPGFYSIEARVGAVAGANSLTREILAVHVDGVQNSWIAEQFHGGKGDIQISGSGLYDLYAGQIIELFIYSDVSCSIYTADKTTHFAIVRLA
ncbi:hypothetical protein [Paenibacillus sp. FSL R7-0333]|uniref:hypothetical protein n=1 Tax=Paenibacillus sp. FSL R7-0333 TaxID=1926587 RepID=UPI00096FA7AA|nr:hypothetical protein BK146_23285 [Paenibacillus sp. FSL R7-0333]